MSQPGQQQEQEPTVADIVISDLSEQLGLAHRELAIARAQWRRLSKFVQDNAEVLGLNSVPPAEESAPPPVAAKPVTED